MSDLPYLDPALPVADRVEDLLSRLTLEEKAGQVTQYFYFGSFGAAFADIDPADVPPEARQFVELPAKVERAVAAGGAGSLLFVRDAAESNKMQKLAIEGSRFGIPVIFGFDVIHGFRTIFPVPIAQAASWDPRLIEDGERRRCPRGASGRHPLGLRADDRHRPRPALGPDHRKRRRGPDVSAARSLPRRSGASRATSDPRTSWPGRSTSPATAPLAADVTTRTSEISDYELWNVYLPPFKAAIDAGAANIMSAYMDLNGVPASGNKWLLTDVLRGALGFEGFVVSDANAVHSLSHPALRPRPDRRRCQGDERRPRHGDDHRSTPPTRGCPDAVAQGLVSEATIDQAVRRVLTAKFSLGLFENPYVDEDAAAGILGAPEHRESATDRGRTHRRAAQERRRPAAGRPPAASPSSASSPTANATPSGPGCSNTTPKRR